MKMPVMPLRSLFAPLLVSLVFALLLVLAFTGDLWAASTDRQRLPDSSQTEAPTGTQWFVNVAEGDDDNSCLSAAAACKTLAAAVAKAAHDDTITLAAGVYPVNNLVIEKRLIIQGTGRAATTLDGANSGRLLQIIAQTTISDLAIRNGAILTPTSDIFDDGGGAILSAGDLTLRNTTVAENSTVGSGGAIFNLGMLTIDDSDVISNTSEGNGGGIYNFGNGTITINRSVLAGNVASGDFGGAINSSKSLSLTDVIVRDNSSGGFGGGLATGGIVELNRVTLEGNQATSGAALFSNQGAITLTNTTISSNVAANNYGGIQLSGAGVSLFLQNSTIAYNSRTNSAGTGYNGLSASNSPVRVVNSIFAFNSERNCGGTAETIVSEGHNLSSDFRCGFDQTGDQQGVDPMLGPLTTFGSMTPVHPLLGGSPAIDSADDSACPHVDQRQVARPFDGDGDGSALCDIGAFEARQQLSIGHATVSEGDSGSTNAIFTVTLAPAATQTVTVDFETAPGSATPGSDYTATSGTLTFDPGMSVKTLSVPILGDTDDEQDETFTVILSNESGADIVNGVGLGTIIDDDGLSALSINDPSVLEGNSGTVDLIFTVTLSPASAQTVTVNYGTSDGTASAGADFDAVSGVLTFAPGQTTQTVTVKVQGDVIDEGASESFTLVLSSPVGATLTDGQGAGEITDDDAARLGRSVGPQTMEGDAGLTPMVFTITLSTPTAFVVTVAYEVSSGVGETGAVAGEDFVATGGELTFQPGQTTQTFTVQIMGDTDFEQDETFQTLIRNGTVPIAVNSASGRILNDDSAVIYLPLIVR